jgi:hypothetical protein
LPLRFSGGNLLGRGWQLSPRVLEISFLCIRSLLIAAFFFAWRKKVWATAIFSLVGWVCLGGVAIVLASRPLPAEHVLSRISAWQIELKTPLRWCGRLRGEPARLPLGMGLEMELSGVETAAGMIRGGG